jgi:hypothetical protein
MIGKAVKSSLLIFAGLLLVSILPALVYADPPVYHDVGTYEIHDFYVRRTGRGCYM